MDRNAKLLILECVEIQAGLTMLDFNQDHDLYVKERSELSSKLRELAVLVLVDDEEAGNG